MDVFGALGMAPGFSKKKIFHPLAEDLLIAYYK
jgi:hypothetical protein